MSDKKFEDSDADIAAFSEALTSALRPADLDADLHEQILARALGLEVDASPSRAGEEPEADEAELRRSAVLASILEGRATSSDPAASDPGLVRLAQLARALRLAYAPTDIDDLAHQRVLGAGLRTPSRTAARRTIVGAVFVLVAAAAAIFGLYLQRRDPGQPPATAMHTGPRAPMIEARSSMELFDAMKPFDREKGTTERVDKITTTRESELRDNRFNAWGVQ